MKIVFSLLVCTVFFLAADSGWSQGPKRRIEVSPETTFITAPVGADGQLDFLAVMKQLGSEGVTPASNMQVGIRQVIGSAGLSEDQVRGHFAELEIPVPSPAYENDFDQWLSGTVLWSESETESKVELENVWSETSNPELAKWIDDKKEAIDQIVEATKREHCYAPIVGKISSPLIMRHLRFRPNVELAELLVARGNLSIHRKQCELATRDAIAVIRMGRLMGQGPYTTDLIGQAIEKIGLILLTRILESEHVDQQSCKLLLDATVAARPDRLEMLRRMRLEVIESICIHNDNRDLLVDLLVKHAKMPAVGIEQAINRFDFNKSARQTNATFDAWIELASSDQPYRDERMKVPVINTSSITKMMSDLKDSLGRDAKKADQLLARWYSHFHPADDFPRGLILSDIENTCISNLAYTACAVSLYRLENGRACQSLADLDDAPYLLDPYSMQRLKYVTDGERFTVYSVGKNLQDDGGVDQRYHPTDFNRSSPDLVLEISRN